MMKCQIDPTVDCVFKAILGDEENKNLLIHFLNAVLEPKKGSMIQDVTILNPYNEREFIGDKLSIVDVKAVDEKGKKYQVEIQLDVHPALAARIIYTWSSIYHSQMNKGDDYHKLKPAISIWLLNGMLFKEIEDYHLSFYLYNLKHKLVMTDHLAIHVLQLPKWPHGRTIKNEKERWIYCFKEGKNVDVDNPPEIMNTKEMRQVMKVMHGFSESQKNYLMYQSRLDAIYTRNTIMNSIEEAKKKIQLAEKEKERLLKDKSRLSKDKERLSKDKERLEKEKNRSEKEKNQALKEKERANQEIQSLKLLLKKKGIKFPDDAQEY